MMKCTWFACRYRAVELMPTHPVEIVLCSFHATHARHIRDSGSELERDDMIRRAAGVDRNVCQSHRKA